MSSTDVPLDNRRAVRVLLQGRVQGVGLRPAVARWAVACGITGWISNDTNGVLLHAEGEMLDHFLEGLQQQLPTEAVISGISIQAVKWEGDDKFDVRKESFPGRLTTAVPVDVVTCDRCLAELLPEQKDRRRAYAFNSCTSCGPRYSLLKAMPFEREYTSMTRYELCTICCKEFLDPEDRRFHAQTMSCSKCGPTMMLTNHLGEMQAWSQVALAGGVAVIMAGKILAFKGLGGYQLICDATDEDAVTTLRARKGRSRKPLAVMVKNLAMADTIADISGCMEVLLNRAGPIVICPTRHENCLSSLIHPGLKQVGVMLPTTACHRLLCDAINKPLVVTSGNREREPLVYSRTDAVNQLSSLCDQMLHHDREIVRPIDDSVVRVMAGRTTTIRLARGLAPYSLPITIQEDIIALSGQQKVALALSNQKQSILGPHLGEMDTVAAQTRFQEHYQSLCQLYGATPRYLVHDLHPDYFTTRWAESQPQQKMAVQHHHAHVVSAMIEQGWLHKTVLGIVFDGTGFGTDATIWGGEFLLSTVDDFQRIAHLRPFSLLGGELAIQQPHRVTLSLLSQILYKNKLTKVLNRLHCFQRYELLLPLLKAPNLHLLTSSVGRLFDGIAALILFLTKADYEGEPAMLLESLCDQSASGSYPLPFLNGQLDWRPMLSALLDDLLLGVDPGVLAMRFHRGLAESIVALIHQYRQHSAVLSGGCFQNKILVELIHELVDDDTCVGFPGTIPCNDGGLAAGQLVIAAARLKSLIL